MAGWPAGWWRLRRPGRRGGVAGRNGSARMTYAQQRLRKLFEWPVPGSSNRLAGWMSFTLLELNCYTPLNLMFIAQCTYTGCRQGRARDMNVSAVYKAGQLGRQQAAIRYSRLILRYRSRCT